MDEYKYGGYIKNNQETRWATVDEIKNSSRHVILSKDGEEASGLPLISDGREVYVDNKDTHTLILGSTGSKKTRLMCLPMIGLYAKAGESFLVTDPKGELYEKTSEYVKKQDYDIVVLNFRNIGLGDCWNPLSIPYELYKKGMVDEATGMLNDFLISLSSGIRSGMSDTYWIEMASSLGLANLLLLLECGTKEQVNVANFSKMCTDASFEILKMFSKLLRYDSVAGINYKGTLVDADNTRSSIFATLYGMIRIFNMQEGLVKMLSDTTFDIKDFGRKKAAVYVIIPDEKTTFHFLAGIFIKQVYEQLIIEAQSCKNLKLPVRFNFLLDEFCNMPQIPDMSSMISAARSRNIRYYLVVQSMNQLRNKYGEEAETIKGNCDNWVYLYSKEYSLLNEISELCGSITLNDGRCRKLISVSELQRLNKDKGETLILNQRNYPFITELPDIVEYAEFRTNLSVEQKSWVNKENNDFSLKLELKRIVSEKKNIPFSKVKFGKDTVDEQIRNEIYDFLR